MPISRSKPPATYVPYSYMTLRGGTVGTSIRVIDSNGNTLELSTSETIQYEILQELRAIRIMLSSITNSHITDEDITNME